MNLYFVINQDPLDGSAHALYCVRQCLALARARPEAGVELVFPGRRDAAAIAAHHGFALPPNLRLTGRPAVRKPRQGRGLTLNLVYYWTAHRHLQRLLRPGDLLVSASFFKLFQFLHARRPAGVRSAFEVHQLMAVDRPDRAAHAAWEFEVLRGADLLVTTTGPLEALLRREVSGPRVVNLGLACAFAPDAFAPAPSPGAAGRPLTLAYVGSLYREQGVEWLLGNWPELARGLARPLRLEIIGGTALETARLEALVRRVGAEGVRLRPAVGPAQLPALLAEVDALIIPALPEGRMPVVAITKAYDYLAWRRPILASALPSITEIVRPTEGLLFEPGNLSSLHAALNRLAANPREAATLAAAAGRRAQDFSWPERAARWWQAAEALR